MARATWNPSDKSSYITLSGGNLIATFGYVTGAGVRANVGLSTGKYYWEITVTGVPNGNDRIGIGNISAAIETAGDIGGNANGWGASSSGYVYHNGAYIEAFSIGSWLNGNIIMVAIDLDAHKLWFGKNGAWFASGDPAAGTGAMYSDLHAETLYPMISLRAGTNGFTANFGASAFSYSVPSGFDSGILQVYNEAIAESLVLTGLIMSNAWDSIDDNLSLAEILGEKYPMLSDESLSIVDRSRGGYLYDKTAESIIITSDLSLMSFLMTFAESLTFTDDTNAGLFEDITESLVLADVLRAPYFALIQDGFFIWVIPKANWHKTVPETLDIADLVTKIFSFTTTEWLWLTSAVENMWHGTETINSNIGLLVSVLAGSNADLFPAIAEYLRVAGAVENMWHGTEAINSGLGVFDSPSGTTIINKTIAEVLEVADTQSIQFLKSVLESLHFDALLSLLQQYETVLEESLSIVDSPSKAFDKLIAEVLSTVDATSVVTTFFNTLLESLSAVDAASWVKRIGASASESLVFTETIVSQGHLHSAIYEKLRLNVTVEMDGETWECYVLNTPKFHPSMYSGFNFNSYCVFENRAFGANDTGIYELKGTTDAGATIHTGAILSETDFGSPNQKRFRRGYLGISGDAPVMVFETEDGQRQAYSIDAQGKTVISSDLKSRSWKLSVVDFTELNTIKLVPVILTK